MKRISFAALAFLVSAGTSTAQSASMGATLDAAEVVPPTTSLASGSCYASVDATNTLVVQGSFEGLESDITGAFLQGPVGRGQNSPTVVFAPTTSGTRSGFFFGNAQLTFGQVADLQAGLLFVNITTSGFPAGEIRGQLDTLANEVVQPELSSDPLLFDTAGDLLLGPNINDGLAPFGLGLNCVSATSPGLYMIQVRQTFLATPVACPVGQLWIAGPKYIAFSGTQAQTIVTTGPPIVLPNDLGLVGLSFAAQGFCGGRLSGVVVQHIGLP